MPSHRRQWQRWTVAALLLVLFLTFVALGTWQIQRRAWKLDLIERVEQRVGAPPVPLPPPADDEKFTGALAARMPEFKSSNLRGWFNRLDAIFRTSNIKKDSTKFNYAFAKLDDTVADDIRSMAIRAFTALDCQGLARVDFFLTEAGPVLNEINTMPGFTTISMFPRMWAASGVDYPTLVATMVDTALARGTGLR